MSSQEEFTSMSEILCSADQAEIFQDDDVKTFMTMMNNVTSNNDVLVPTSSSINVVPNTDQSQLITVHHHEEIKYENGVGHCEPLVLTDKEFEGPFNFHLKVGCSDTKDPWEFSTTLSKLYIDMGTMFPVDFCINNYIGGVLYVRVTPVYSQPQYAQMVVHRCLSHEHALDPSNTNLPSHILQHIVRCRNPNAIYLGDKNQNERLNLLIPLGSPQIGTDNVREMFEFVCKSSCTGGMNRRPIKVIFTLEDITGSTVGRRVLAVRICSCPKRDRNKEEKRLNPQQSMRRSFSNTTSGNTKNKNKKLHKLDNNKLLPIACASTTLDLRRYKIDVTVIGQRNYELALKYCQDLMAGEIIRHSDKNGVDAPFRKCYNDINALRRLNHN